MTLGEEATKTALKARLAGISNITDEIKKKIKEAAEKGQEECIVLFRMKIMRIFLIGYMKKKSG